MPVTRSVGKGRRQSTETKPSSSNTGTTAETATTAETSATGTSATETSATGTTATGTTASGTTATGTTKGTSATEASVTTRDTGRSLATATSMVGSAATIVKKIVELTAAPTESPRKQPTEAHAEAKNSVRVPRAPSQRAESTRSRSKAHKIAKAKEELIRLQVELATARLAVLETEEEEDDVSEYSKTEADTRVDQWLNQQAQPMLAIAHEPHQPLRETEIEANITEEPRPVQQINREHYVRPEQRVPTAAGAQAPAGGHIQPDFSHLTTAITQAIKASQRSSKFVELPTFNGGYQDWLPFKAAYEETEHAFSQVENINRLRRHLVGRAREAVESLLITNTHPSDVMKTLETRFGRPETIATAEIETLRALPRLHESPRDICVFSTKVTNAVSTLRALNCVYYLYNPEVAKAMVDKLTPTLRYRYYDFAATQPRDQPDLLKFEKFMKREAELCGPYAQPEQIASPMYNAHNRRPQKTNTVYEKQSIAPQKCPVCEAAGHNTTDCKEFKEANENIRWDIAKKRRLCFRCLRYRNKTHYCRAKPCGINGCKYFHNSMLHYNKTEKAITEKNESTEVINSAWTTRPTKRQTYLKIIPVQATGPKGTINTYALLDDGSTVTLIDDSTALSIGAKGPIDPLKIEAIGEMRTAETKSRRVIVTIRGRNNYREKVHARTIKNLRVSSQGIPRDQIEECEHLRDITDILTYENAKPTILIGQDNWHLLLASRVRKGRRDQPVASLTPLGWVLHGRHDRISGHIVNFVSHLTEEPHEESLEELMKRYFAMDSLCIDPKRPRSDPEEQALRILESSTMRNKDGRYETALLWKREDINLPNNYESSLKRLLHIEKKLDRDVSFKKKYTAQMEALIEKGYAELAPKTTTPNRTWYLPHFAVVNRMKPDKLRVVHDAAAKTNGVALNDLLLKGPDLLQSLPGVVMKFRQHKVAVTADIKEMFMQVKLKTEDRDALRYLWRGERRDNQPPEEYRMTSLIFGASSSPSTAIYVKDLNAKRYERTEPEAASAIIQKHYVDDYLDSFRSLEDAVRIATSVRNIHSEAGFELKQWKSNTPALLQALGEEESTQRIELYKAGEQLERVLGIIWRPETDELTFNLNLTRVPHDLLEGKTPTKREALRIVMSLFDPLGFASPVTIKAKQILQELWRRGTTWDEQMEENVAEQWRDWMVHLKDLSNVSIPRRYLQYSDATSLQLHVFTDASESAYTAVLYWRATAPDGEVRVSFIISKAKVAPLKLTSIPRLELQAAVMGARLAEVVVEEHEKKPDSKTFWTDSRTVLTWLRTGSRSYKPYVAHRLAAIEESTKVNEWRWVPTKFNVADDATRDVPIEFNKDHRWYKGPDFLYEDSSTWPTETQFELEPTGEEKIHYIATNRKLKLADGLPQVSRFSNWERLRYATARVLQFIQLCRIPKEKVNYKRNRRNAQTDPDWRNKKKTPSVRQAKLHTNYNENRQYLVVPAELLRKAEELLMRSSQEECFLTEIEDIKHQKPINRESRLHQLSVEYRNDALRLRSRIEAVEAVSADVKSPMVLDGNHPTVKLWIQSIHKQMHHAGVEATVNECRQRYWILRLRPITRTLLRRCIKCRMKTQTPPYPRTGDLPSCRLAHHKRPFTYTGVDYFGPFVVTVGRTNQKRYVVIFTCLTTRAIHLEIAASLSTDSAVMALRRMMARRGSPVQIWSDNGTNLKGADRELRQAIDEATEKEAAKKTISWRFIPPGAPFMGGAWERLVRSVKTALQATLHERHPTEEVLTTLLTEVEYTVNSRPLTHVSVNVEDPEALTPNHFLLGGNGQVTTPGEFNDKDTINKHSWRAAQRLVDIFWSRWLKEYLPELQNRREPHGRGTTVKNGDLVQIIDSNLPRNVWVRGRVTATYPGPDHIVRTVDVTTKGGILRRPVRKLVVLPIEDVVPAPTEDASQLHGGRDVQDDDIITHRIK